MENDQSTPKAKLLNNDFESLSMLHKADFKYQSSNPQLERITSLALEKHSVFTSKQQLSPGNSKTVRFSPKELKAFNSLIKVAESSEMARDTVIGKGDKPS